MKNNVNIRTISKLGGIYFHSRRIQSVWQMLQRVFRSFWNHLLLNVKSINRDDDLGQRHMEIVFRFGFLQKRLSSKDLREGS